MFFLNLFVFFAIGLTKVAAIDNLRFENLAKFTKELIEYERVPSFLWIQNCWPKIEDLKFTQRIPFAVQIVKSSAPINLTIGDETNKQWFFVDMACKESLNFLLKVDEKYFAHPYRWILADGSARSIQNLTFLPGSNIILANQEEDSSRYILKQGNISDIFWISPSSKCQFA